MMSYFTSFSEKQHEKLIDPYHFEIEISNKAISCLPSSTIMFVFKPKLDRKDHSILDKPSSLLYSKGNLVSKISWNQVESMRILERLQLQGVSSLVV